MAEQTHRGQRHGLAPAATFRPESRQTQARSFARPSDANGNNTLWTSLNQGSQAHAIVQLWRSLNQRSQVTGLATLSGRLQRTPDLHGLSAQNGPIQRFIKVKDDASSYAPGNWAFKYQDLRGKHYTFAKLREAFDKIDGTAQATDYYDNAAALFERVEELVEAAKDKAVQPIWRETSPSKVMMALEYDFADCVQLPTMVLKDTYQSNWDTKGGFGAEYAPANENMQHWVIHVHRGQNGGLKSAKVKSWATRGVGHNGSQLFKFDNLAQIGIPKVDTTQV